MPSIPGARPGTALETPGGGWARKQRRAAPRRTLGPAPPAGLRCHLLSLPGGALCCPACRHQPATHAGSIMKGKCHLSLDKVPRAALQLCAGHSPRPQTRPSERGLHCCLFPGLGTPQSARDPVSPTSNCKPSALRVAPVCPPLKASPQFRGSGPRQEAAEARAWRGGAWAGPVRCGPGWRLA